MERVTVCIWMPSGLRTFLGIGHAAIKLTRKDGKRYYITWSAQGSPVWAPFGFMNCPRYEGVGTDKLTYEVDKGLMEPFFQSHEPHFKIKLPTLTLSNGNLKYGVSTRLIEKFWEKRLEEEMYAFFSAKYNCTGCVWEVLKAGGLNHYHAIRDSRLVQGAAGLLAAVTKARDVIKDLTRRREAVEEWMDELTGRYTKLPKGIPTLAEWKEASNENVRFGPFAGRRDQVAALDRLIEDYHSTSNVVVQFVTLFQMQWEVYSHQMAKPMSDRRAAVELLGARATAVLRTMPTDLSLDKLSDDQYQRVVDTLGWRSVKLAASTDG